MTRLHNWLAAALLLAPLTAASAQVTPLHALRSICAPGDSARVQDDLVVSGIVVSDFRSENVALNPSVTAGTVDLSVNDKTVYLQEPDGSMGVRLMFTSPGYNRCERYDHLEVNLRGCLIERAADPDVITVSGLKAGNVVSKTVGQPSDVAVKSRTISELRDSDICTQVQLRDLDVICKNGNWANIHEGYSQYCWRLHRDVSYRANGNPGRMDGWATLMRDFNGDCIYLNVNTLCPWRKNGVAVPQGAGDVTGVIVHEPNRRYGGDMGRYSIRPMFRDDIRLSSKRSTSPWKTLTGWEYDGTGGQFINFEKLGVQGGVWKNGKVGDRVMSDRGDPKAYLWTDSGNAVHIGGAFEKLTADASYGKQGNGSVDFKGRTVDWYVFGQNGEIVDTRSLLMEFSAASVSGQYMRLSFSWTEGDQDPNNDEGYPAEWEVMCSLDGGDWISLKETATGNEVINLRCEPYWDRTLKDGRKVQTSYDAALGTQTRCFSLPAEAFGCKDVIVRITPASASVVKLGAVFSDPTVGVDFISPDRTSLRTFIVLDNLMIDYK